jgi:lipopolysaccharide/colanic/teichoic acid biosynthesis glycosyltransferase
LSRRGIEFAIAALALLCVMPLFCVIIVAVRAESRGPALVRCRISGRDGRIVEVYGFRTTVLVGRYAGYPTRFGQCLRVSSTDELPRLISVLVGEASFRDFL